MDVVKVNETLEAGGFGCGCETSKDIVIGQSLKEGGKDYHQHMHDTQDAGGFNTMAQKLGAAVSESEGDDESSSA
ncbi:MAG: hypothetical protein R3C68_16255 [Myxococcota bacterium]